MADMEAQGPSMDIIKELSISDTDSDYAEDMRFDKLEVPATDPCEPAAVRFEGVLATCKAMKLQPGQSILAFAKQMIEEHVCLPSFASIAPTDITVAPMKPICMQCSCQHLCCCQSRPRSLLCHQWQTICEFKQNKLFTIQCKQLYVRMLASIQIHADTQTYCFGVAFTQTLDDTFYVIDLGLLARLHAHFVAAMPRVTPFYAVKCMPDRAMMATLAGLGAPFSVLSCCTQPYICSYMAYIAFFLLLSTGTCQQCVALVKHISCDTIVAYVFPQRHPGIQTIKSCMIGL